MHCGHPPFIPTQPGCHPGHPMPPPPPVPPAVVNLSVVKAGENVKVDIKKEKGVVYYTVSAEDGGIQDAPKDGNLYGRQDESWVKVDSIKGDKGDPGDDGKSAYEIAVEEGYTGTQEEWVASLKGEDGRQGVDGKSAYEIAVEEGFSGTEEEWISSLKGEKGDKGEQGIDGRTADEFTGATATADGEKGLVTKPIAGQQNSVLMGDAKWHVARPMTIDEIDTLLGWNEGENNG